MELTPEIVRPAWAANLRSGKYKQIPHKLCTELSDGTFGYCQMGVLCITVNELLSGEEGGPVFYKNESTGEWTYGDEECPDGESAIFPPQWILRAAGFGMIEGGDGKFRLPSHPGPTAEREADLMSAGCPEYQEHVAVATGNTGFEQVADSVDTLANFEQRANADIQMLTSVVGRDEFAKVVADLASAGCVPFEEVAPSVDTLANELAA